MNEQTVRYLANIYDPRNPGAKRQFVRSFYAHASIEEKEREWGMLIELVNKCVIGPPKATETYTVNQLRGMGIIGLYAPLTDTPLAADEL